MIESGPFTTLEQAMLAGELEHRRITRGFGVYNAVAAAAGSLGALAAAGIGPLHSVWSTSPSHQRFFLLLVPAAGVGMVLAGRLSDAVEQRRTAADPVESRPLGPSRPIVVRLAALFSLDSFGGGFIVQAFVAFWLAQRFDASVGVIGVTFFAVGVLQTLSFLASGRLADHFGMLPTMVFTHLPSNLCLDRHRVLAHSARRHRLDPAAHAAVADGRTRPSGLRDGARRALRAHRRGVDDQHRPLPHASRWSGRWRARRSRSRSGSHS